MPMWVLETLCAYLVEEGAALGPFQAHGYMDGAIQAGERAADEVLAR